MIGYDSTPAGNAVLRQCCDELSRRLRAGQSCRAEEYLEQTPEINADAGAATELIYTEFVVCEQLGQHPDPSAWLERFPQFRGELEQLFEVHRLVADVPSLEPATDTQRNFGAGTAGRIPREPESLRSGQIGNYELLEEIGRGGMGAVYRARQRGLSRLVALKMVLPPHGPRERARFRAEAEATARLSHPNIVPIYEVGEENGCPYLSMELVAGVNLDQRLMESPLAPREAAELLLALACAASCAHEQGIVHRDLKPANILLAADGTPKITDFGLARRLSPADSPEQPPAAATQTGAIVGTPSYMAPEQCAGGRLEVGPAADVYALGAILYESLTGRPPFRGQTPFDTLDLVRNQEPVPPRRLVPKTPRDLETICLKCLAKEPRQRYATAQALADDLRRYLEGRPICARPTGAFEHGWRWCCRRPLVAALSAALALALVVGIGGFVWQWRATAAALHDQALAEQAEKLQGKYAQSLASARLVAVAHRQWLDDRQDEARRLLAQCPPEHRTAEWENLYALSHAKIAARMASASGTQHVFFSPSGNSFGVTRTDSFAGIDIFAAETGQDRFHLPGGHRVECAAFNSDETTLTMIVVRPTGGQSIVRNHEVWELDTQTKQDSFELERGATIPRNYSQSVIGSDGGPLAWVSAVPPPGTPRVLQMRKVSIWDSATRRTAHTLDGAPGFFYRLAMSTGGERLAAAKAPGTLLVLDARSGAELASFERSVNAGTRISLSGNGQFLACASGGPRSQAEIQVWNVSDKRQSARWELATWAYAIHISHDGQFLAVAQQNMTVELWRVADGQRLASLRGHRAHISAVAISRPAHRLVSVDADGTIVLWDIGPWTGPVSPMRPK